MCMAQSQTSGQNWAAVDELGTVIGGLFDTKDEARDWLDEGENRTGFVEPMDQHDGAENVHSDLPATLSESNRQKCLELLDEVGSEWPLDEYNDLAAKVQRVGHILEHDEDVEVADA